jgi:hypothetical protein
VYAGVGEYGGAERYPVAGIIRSSTISLVTSAT